jgi:glycosidase
MRRIALALAFLAAACSDSTPDAGAPSTKTTTAPPTTPTAEQEAAAQKLLTGPDWYRHAVVYEVNVRSFSDSNGDGIGDLAGLVSRLDYLRGLGVDAIWLMPIMPTAFKDSGYDISDYRDISKDYGTLAGFDALVAAAHARKIRVFMDLVLNHTSSEHPWFQASRASKTGPKADWYVWSDKPNPPDNGCGTDGPQFGDSAWTYDEPRKQYYFHRFYPEQPDLNYRNPEVVKETLDVARFWLARGVDGFRCDVIGLLFETATVCNMAPETIEYIKKLRAVLDEFPDRAMVAEATLSGAAPYFGSGKDMFHMAFDFPYGYFWNMAFLGGDRKVPFDAFTTVLTKYPAGAQDAVPIGSHDVPRASTRAQGYAWRQQRAVEISMLTKGTPFVYYGEEVGIRGGTAVVVDGRDQARTPMPWTKAAGHGFSTAKPWIAFADGADETNVETEDADASSMLTFYRSLLTFRRGHAVWGTGDMKLLAVDAQALLVFTRSNGDESYLVVENLSEDDQEGSLAGAGIAAPGALVWGAGEASLDGGTLRVKVPGQGSAVFALAR